MLEKVGNSRGSKAGHIGEHRADIGLAFLALEGNCESVGFIPNALEQKECVTVARQNHRVIRIGQPDLFQPFRNATQLDARDARVIERALCSGNLRLPAVDDQ